MHTSSCVNQPGSVQPPLHLVLVQTLSAIKGKFPSQTNRGNHTTIPVSLSKVFFDEGHTPSV